MEQRQPPLSFCPWSLRSSLILLMPQRLVSSSIENGLCCESQRHNDNLCRCIIRLRSEQAQTQALGQVLRGKLPLDAISHRVKQRRVGSKPSLARRDSDNPAADSTLPRQPNIVKPVS